MKTKHNDLVLFYACDIFFSKRQFNMISEWFAKFLQCVAM